FSPAARYPRQPLFGAAGVAARAGAGPINFSGEYAYSGSGGHAVYARAIWMAPPLAETTLSVRHYSAEYENPHSGAESEPDLLLGNPQRDEQGVKLENILVPTSGVRVVSDVDLW